MSNYFCNIIDCNISDDAVDAMTRAIEEWGGWVFAPTGIRNTKTPDYKPDKKAEKKAWMYLKLVLNDEVKFRKLRDKIGPVLIDGSAGGQYYLYPSGKLVRLDRTKPFVGTLHATASMPLADVFASAYIWITQREKEFKKNWGCGNIDFIYNSHINPTRYMRMNDNVAGELRRFWTDIGLQLDTWYCIQQYNGVTYIDGVQINRNNANSINMLVGCDGIETHPPLRNNIVRNNINNTEVYARRYVRRVREPIEVNDGDRLNFNGNIRVDDNRLTNPELDWNQTIELFGMPVYVTEEQHTQDPIQNYRRDYYQIFTTDEMHANTLYNVFRSQPNVANVSIRARIDHPPIIELTVVTPDIERENISTESISDETITLEHNE